MPDAMPDATPDAMPGAPVPVAEIVRSGFVEGHHHGSVVALAADGSVEWSVGAATRPVLPRSCNKPIQTVGMLRAGLDPDGTLPSELVALACASHSGEAFHLEGVRRLLGIAGLDESALRNTPDLPLADAAKQEALRAGAPPSPLMQNCSGKHAAMLLTCVRNGWDTDTYLEPDHPLQQALLTAFADLTGEPVTTVAVDGCGAPLYSTSLVGLARAFRRIALATDGPEHRVAEAIRSHPAYVSGTERDERTLLEAVPGAIGKAGAEGCYAVALPDGRAFALKIEDGAARARPVVMAAALARSGADRLPGVDTAALLATGTVPVHGGGREVGRIRSLV